MKFTKKSRNTESRQALVLKIQNYFWEPRKTSYQEELSWKEVVVFSKSYGELSFNLLLQSRIGQTQLKPNGKQCIDLVYKSQSWIQTELMKSSSGKSGK